MLNISPNEAIIDRIIPPTNIVSSIEIVILADILIEFVINPTLLLLFFEIITNSNGHSKEIELVVKLGIIRWSITMVVIAAIGSINEP